MTACMKSTDSKSDMTTTKTTATQAKTPAVAAGGAAASLENPGGKGPEGDSDMAGGEKPGEQQQEQKENEKIQ